MIIIIITLNKSTTINLKYYEYVNKLSEDTSTTDISITQDFFLIKLKVKTDYK